MNDEGDSASVPFYVKQGAPTEPGLCPVCRVRPGTEQTQNVTGALGGEPPDATPDEWLCRSCLEAQVIEGWVASVENVERLLRVYPASRQELEPAAARLAAHLRAEVDRLGLHVPEPVCDFLARHGA